MAGAGWRDARRRARELASRGETGELRAAGRALGALVEALEHPRKSRLDAARIDAYRRQAEQLAAADGDPELTAVSREILEVAALLEGNGHRLPTEPQPQVAVRRRRAIAFPRRRTIGIGVAAVAVVALLAGGALAARPLLAPGLSTDGPEVTTLGPKALANAAVGVRGDSDSLRWRVDGQDATGAVVRRDGILVLPLADLADGEHTVEVVGRAGFLGGRRTRRYDFTVDTTPPAIRLTTPAVAKAWQPLELRGTAAGATILAVDRHTTALDVDGRFVVRRTPPVPQAVTLTATDEAGNRAERRVTITLVPRRPPVPVRAVHVTSYAWADDELRSGVLRLVDQHRINAVELDLKDESGIVGFAAAIPYGRRIGSIRRIYDLEDAVRQLHARGVRVIGRLVCFRDPVHAAAAWKAGRRNEVIQTPGGAPYAGYGGFTNFADETVRRYNVDVAVAAARAGVDDVLYDYVRRPDGPRSSMRFPGLTTTPESAIVEFLRESRVALRPFGTYLGASVFGVAATRPLEVAQPIRRMAAQVDYVAPMVYPSHWGSGEYDVPNPNSQPYEIVRRSLLDFSRDVRGAGARVVPWLQDFSLGVTYGPGEVRAQIQAARRDGIDEFILWDPAVTYTAEALAPNAATSRKGLAQLRPAQTAAKEAPAATPTPKPAGGRAPNELGEIPVLMHHEVRPDRVGDYDQTPAEFRGELQRLWREGYYPVTASDLVEGRLGRVPAGKTPVVLTFDDSTRYQLFFRDGRLVPNTAVAILRDFARTHPGFRATGTFYVLREPFGGVPQATQWLRWLVRQGFELGNHTHDHIPLRTLSATDVQKELALGQQVITAAVPGYRVRTMALPLGSMPRQPSLARRGRWQRLSYASEAVFLIGAGPAFSPYSTSFDRAGIPRIRSSHVPWSGAMDFTAAYWLRELARHPERRYVSDGDPKHLAFPQSEQEKLRPRFRAQAEPY